MKTNDWPLWLRLTLIRVIQYGVLPLYMVVNFFVGIGYGLARGWTDWRRMSAEIDELVAREKA